MLDISLCSNENCPRYKDCSRGEGEKHNPGVYTIKNFSNECNEVTNYGWYIPKDYNWKEKI